MIKVRHCPDCGKPWVYELNEGGDLRPVIYHHPNCPQAGSSGRNRTAKA